MWAVPQHLKVASEVQLQNNDAIKPQSELDAATYKSGTSSTSKPQIIANSMRNVSEIEIVQLHSKHHATAGHSKESIPDMLVENVMHLGIHLRSKYH
ncbi:hypothetical protein AVEN_273927-1 [Araneus ventricosus]|uniref:Uncharacterized protein n=1 Tax=Araneus ventricosus TaxID=182803 RepID=A0A4Y2I2Q9_ARAVE|nr:hypothetical protein AVEN_273927-1 [Araneus ventricosus]